MLTKLNWCQSSQLSFEQLVSCGRIELIDGGEILAEVSLTSILVVPFRVEFPTGEKGRENKENGSSANQWNNLVERSHRKSPIET